MAINPIGNDSTYSAGIYKTATPKTTESKKNEEEKKEKQAEITAPKEDTFEKSKTYKPDIEKVNAMKSDLANNVSAFRQMVQGLFQTQGNFAGNALNILLNIDEATQAKAKEAVSEDGEWGVKAVSDRILDFAKALSGGDPSKIDLLRGAVEKGFKAAEKIWGGELPEISKQTYERVMDGFKEWEESAKTGKVPGATETEEK